MNTNKEKTHIWFGSRNRIAGTYQLPAGGAGVAAGGSPNSGFDLNIQFPQSMPKYSKYTVQIKQFGMRNKQQTQQGAAGTLTPNYECPDGTPASQAVLYLRGLPYIGNFEQCTGSDVVRTGGGNGSTDCPFLTRISLDTGSLGAGSSCVEPKTDQPKIAVGRLNGFCTLTAELRDPLDMSQYPPQHVVVTPNAGGGNFRALGEWIACLEIEGIDGCEEFSCPARDGQPLVTNGLNNQNHQGFQNNNKKITRLNTSFR